MMKFLKGATNVALALLIAVSSVTPSYAKNDDLGKQSQKYDSGDQVTSRSAVTSTAPTAGAQSIPATVTTNYLHKEWLPWRNNKVYHIQTPATADYVVRLDYWMLNADGTLFRFNKGSNVGIETSRPTVDIGTVGSMLSSSDRGVVVGVSAGAVSADGSSRTVNVAYKYTHAETYNDVTYTLNTTVSSTFVAEQSAHMVWIGNTLYKVNSAGRVDALREKPTANIGERSSRISTNDQSVSWEPTVSAGAMSGNGRTRTLNVTRDYIHEETFQKLRYSITQETNATFVPEQNAHMSWIGEKLYRVRVGTDYVEQLSSKPVTNLGYRSYKIDYSDALVSVQVTPKSLTNDSKSIVVEVRRNWRHSETYQVKDYYGQDTQIAHYNETYKVWTVIVDGRIYAIAFDSDVVTNDGSVIVIKAPGGMKRPDVIVVKPNGEDPPVVVPGKNRPPVVDTDDAPPVVVPGKRKPVDNDPPVVVPGKKKPVVIDTDDDDAPAVVVPRR